MSLSFDSLFLFFRFIRLVITRDILNGLLCLYVYPCYVMSYSEWVALFVCVPMFRYVSGMNIEWWANAPLPAQTPTFYEK